MAEQQLGVYRKTTGRIEPIGSFEPGLILDAVIGYGLEGAPRRPAEEAIGWMKGRTAPVISLDVPSGLDATTGESTGESVEAAITVTLALPKTGLLAGAAGEIWLADLGIPHEIYAIAGIEVPQPLFDHGYLMRLHRRGL